MEIDGPLKIGIITQDNSLDREIHIDFADDFKSLGLPAQAEAFTEYMQRLKAQSKAVSQESQECQGILMVLQIVEQLAPHIQTGEIPLNETIVIKMQSGSMLGNLISDRALN